MAKWGEGDPRWIVEERADAKNVNNWHWTEKNASQWSKDKLTELLKNLTIENTDYNCTLSSITTIEGEATANNRKAKLIFFYEWKIEGEWQGEIKTGENRTKYKGKFEVLNLSEENEPDEVDIEVTTKSSSKDGFRVKEFMRKDGANEIRSQLAKYIGDLKQEYSKNLILPSKNGTTATEADSSREQVQAKVALNQPVVSASSDHKTSSGTKKILTKKLTMKEEFVCSPDDLFSVFTDEQRMAAFTQSAVQCDYKKGGHFSLFSGVVSGFFDDMDKPNKLIMRWRHKNWPSEHYSNCTLTFEPKDNSTQLTIVQSGVPEQEVDNTRNGWQQFYFQAIKHTFAYGGNLF